MPGLAVAKVMASRGWKISWIGTTTGMESGLVGREGIEFHGLNFQGVRGRGPIGALKGGVKLIGAFLESRKLLRSLEPTAVFSTGGYVAVPVGVAASRMKLPLEKFFLNLETTGNTSAASIPLALDEAVRKGELTDGMKIVLCGFGAGLTYAGTYMQWPHL